MTDLYQQVLASYDDELKKYEFEPVKKAKIQRKAEKAAKKAVEQEKLNPKPKKEEIKQVKVVEEEDIFSKKYTSSKKRKHSDISQLSEDSDQAKDSKPKFTIAVESGSESDKEAEDTKKTEKTKKKPKKSGDKAQKNHFEVRVSSHDAESQLKFINVSVQK